MSEEENSFPPKNDQEFTDPVQQENLRYLLSTGLNKEICELLVRAGFDSNKHVLREQNKHKHINKYEGVDKLIVMAYSAGASLHDLIRVFGWTQGTISNVVRQQGELRPPGRSPRYTSTSETDLDRRVITEEDKDKMVRLYTLDKDKGRLNLWQIASEFGLSYATVREIVSKKVTLRGSAEDRQPRSSKKRDQNG